MTTQNKKQAKNPRKKKKEKRIRIKTVRVNLSMKEKRYEILERWAEKENEYPTRLACDIIEKALKEFEENESEEEGLSGVERDLNRAFKR
jgi:hypothetical protein